MIDSLTDDTAELALSDEPMHEDAAPAAVALITGNAAAATATSMTLRIIMSSTPLPSSGSTYHRCPDDEGTAR